MATYSELDDVERMDAATRALDNLETDAEMMARLAAVGVTEEALEAGKARMEAVYAALSSQQGAKTATVKKGKALTALDTCMAPFLKVARAEFADEPERLARLGL